MKDFKNKEIILGAVVIGILSVIALSLIVKRELDSKSYKTQVKSAPTAEQFSSIETVEDSVEMEEEDSADTISVREQMSDSIAADTVTVQKNNAAAIKTKEKNANQLYRILGRDTYQPYTMVERKEEDGQMAELFSYWDAYKLQAVSDLIHLDRVRAISEELKGTSHYYYYGGLDKLGRPNGKGLAIYPDDTYYCGEFKDGLRHGAGMWLQVAFYEKNEEKLNLGLIEHMYNGEWSKDLPNGEGQEHFEYDYSILNEKGDTITNVIGTFKNGLYHGDMYIMTANNNGNTTDWYGTCENGSWVPMSELSPAKMYAIWYADEDNERYQYMQASQNIMQGVLGMKR